MRGGGGREERGERRGREGGRGRERKGEEEKVEREEEGGSVITVNESGFLFLFISFLS